MNKATVGALVGGIGAFLAAKGAGALFERLAAETNAIIIEKHGPALTIETSSALQSLHRSVAAEGGLRGFLAGRILANGGLGYPEVNEAAVRVWVLAVIVGAIIGAIAGAKRWWAVPVIVVAAVWGATAQQSPVALATILLGGAVGGAIALATLEVMDCLSAPAEPGRRNDEQ